MEFPERGADTPKDSVICKQSHWPRSENWQLSEKPTSKTGKTRLQSSLFACFNICTGLEKKKHSMFLVCKANIRVFFCECVFCLHLPLYEYQDGNKANVLIQARANGKIKPVQDSWIYPTGIDARVA